MSDTDFYKTLLQFLGPALDASLDPIALVDATGHIVMASASMRLLLGLRARELDQKPEFCDCIKLDACKTECQVIKAVNSMTTLTFAENPASIGETKLRVQLRIVPVANTYSDTETGAVGAVIAMRDTSPELILQAKYKKLKTMLDERDAQIARLNQLLGK